MCKGKMNIYLVVSEVLLEPYYYSVPREPYCIAELVVADSRDQAKWLVWKSDKDSYTGDARDMPKMSVRIKQRCVSGPARIYTREADSLSEQEQGCLWS